MAISDRNINFRAPEETFVRLKALMKLFERDRSWILRKAADVFFTLMFAPEKLREFYAEWQAYLGNNGQRGATQQFTFQFPPEVSFRPKFGYREEQQCD